MTSTWRTYVGDVQRDHVHLDHGGLSWQQAHDELREWVLLYVDDDRSTQARDARDVLEVLDHPSMVGRPMLGEIAGEWHAIFRDPPPVPKPDGTTGSVTCADPRR